MSGDLPHTALGEQIRRKTPAGRWGEPSDLVGAAIFWVYHHVNTQYTSEQAATEEFDRERARFAGHNQRCGKHI